MGTWGPTSPDEEAQSRGAGSLPLVAERGAASPVSSALGVCAECCPTPLGHVCLTLQLFIVTKTRSNWGPCGQVANCCAHVERSHGCALCGHYTAPWQRQTSQERDGGH